MRNLLFVILMGSSLNAFGVETISNAQDEIALRHVEKFVTHYGEKSVTIKKNDGQKYIKLRTELGTFATAEVLNQVLDDQEGLSTDLSFALSILFSSEANSNNVKKKFKQEIRYTIIDKSISAEGTKYLVARGDRSKLIYEVHCSEQSEKGFFGREVPKLACIITQVTPKEEF